MRWVGLVVALMAGCSFSTAGIGQVAAGEGGVAADVSIDGAGDAPADVAGETAAPDQSLDAPAPELPTIVVDSSVDTASGLPLGTLCLRDQDCASGACVSKIRSFLSICCVSDCKPDGWEEGCTPTGQYCQGD